MKTQKVVVYGTLRSGHYNNRLMETSDFISKVRLNEKATMYSNGGFPILSFAETGNETEIVGELYEVPEGQAMARLDALEGYPRWYNRTEREFTTESGDTVTAWIYHQDHIFNDLQVVESGDWDKHVQRRYG